MCILTIMAHIYCIILLVRHSMPIDNMRQRIKRQIQDIQYIPLFNHMRFINSHSTNHFAVHFVGKHSSSSFGLQ